MHAPQVKGVQSAHALIARVQSSLINGPSNLTFGTGGKDKDGNSVSGWGYYEVGAKDSL